MIYSSLITIGELISAIEKETIWKTYKCIAAIFYIQAKGSYFHVLDSDDYMKKIDCQLERFSYLQLDHNPLNKFSKSVASFIKKWKQKKFLDSSWCRFI